MAAVGLVRAAGRGLSWEPAPGLTLGPSQWEKLPIVLSVLLAWHVPPPFAAHPQASRWLCPQFKPRSCEERPALYPQDSEMGPGRE